MRNKRSIDGTGKVAEKPSREGRDCREKWPGKRGRGQGTVKLALCGRWNSLRPGSPHLSGRGAFGTTHLVKGRISPDWSRNSPARLFYVDSLRLNDGLE